MKRERQRAPDLCPFCGASWDCEHGDRRAEKKVPSDLKEKVTAILEEHGDPSEPRYLTWRDVANEVLAPMFRRGTVPSDKAIFDAYPFSMRKYWPYKVWLEQVRWWKAGCPDKRGRKRPVEPLPGQLPLEQA